MGRSYRLLLVLASAAVAIMPACDSDAVSPAGSGGAPGGAPGSPGGSGGSDAAGGSGGLSTPPLADELSQIMAAYRGWQALSASPVDISAQLFALCRGTTPLENQFTSSVHSRHALQDWVNPAAAAGLVDRGAHGYAVGSTIVKEKYAAIPAAEMRLVALGFMVKRAPGFDPPAGDWEFAYWDSATGFSPRGRTETVSCSSCHASASATDFVFEGTPW